MNPANQHAHDADPIRITQKKGKGTAHPNRLQPGKQAC